MGVITAAVLGAACAAAADPAPPCPVVSLTRPCAAASASSTIATPAALCKIIVPPLCSLSSDPPPPPTNDYALAPAGLHAHLQRLFDSASRLCAIGVARATVRKIPVPEPSNHYRQWSCEEHLPARMPGPRRCDPLVHARA